MPRPPELTPAELNLMKVLWRLGKATVADARAELNRPEACRATRREGGELAYTTVMTVLARLLTKGAVTRRREGRSFVWMPAADEAGLAAWKMHRVLDSERDRRAVLASFITRLPEGEEQLLRELLDRAGEED